MLSFHGVNPDVRAYQPPMREHHRLGTPAERGIRIKRATFDDGREISTVFSEAYGNSSHPCADKDTVINLLQGRQMDMLLAIEDDRIIGCVACNSLRAPGVKELGCLAVRPGRKHFRLAHILHNSIVDYATSKPDCDLIVAFARSTSVLRLGAAHTHAPLFACGHDGAMNIANNVREHHAILLAGNPKKKICRALPSKPIHGIERWLSSKKNVSTLEYMPSSAWAAPSMWINSCPAKASCIELASPSVHGTVDQALTSIELESLLHKNTQHQYVFALAEKIDFVEGMKELSFTATAYLPAWFQDGPVRRDCILMVKSTDMGDASMNGFNKIVRSWNRRLNREMTSRKTDSEFA